MYASDCDFTDFDIEIGPALSFHFCSDQCLLNAQCTHFTWGLSQKEQTQTCWSKRGPDLTNPLAFPVIYLKGYVCGYLTNRKPVTSSKKILTTERVQGMVYFIISPFE